MATKITTINADNLVQRYLSGESEKALAEVLNVSRGVIRRILLSKNVKPRNRSQAMYNRMANTSKEERKRLSEAAHNAVRGRKRNPEEMNKAAITKQRKLSKLGAGELELQCRICKKGFECIPQFAFERYNIDLAFKPVAVELWSDPCNPLNQTRTHNVRKTKRLCKSCWAVIWIWTPNGSVSESCIDYIVSFLDRANSDPSLIGQYRVIRGSGDVYARGSFNSD